MSPAAPEDRRVIRGWLVLVALGMLGVPVLLFLFTLLAPAVTQRFPRADSPARVVSPGPGPLAARESSAPPIQPLVLRPDDAPDRALPGIVPGSHVKISLPSLPYLSTSHAINGALIRPADNAAGWEFDMAVAYREVNETTYEFDLRKGVVFQDGTPFDADAVVMNMESFLQKPVTYSKIADVLERVEKVDDHTVRFHLNQKYGSFLNDAIWLQFYSETYLKTNEGGWNGKPSCPNLSMPGKFGLGPYVLEKGYVEGDRQTAMVVLKANPLYWDQRYPKVETITVYTELPVDQGKNAVLYRERELDITFIPPEDKVETILSPHGKLVVSPSTDNIAIHLNLINGNPRLRDRAVRRALNEALNTRHLLHFVFEYEGYRSPISPHFPGVSEVSQRLLPVPLDHDPYAHDVQERLRSVLAGLELKVLTQERFKPMWRGIQTQLRKVGVSLDLEFTLSEKEIFEPLLSTNAGQNQKQWDLLVWGNNDWYSNHPFTAFFVFRTHNVWSTIAPDPIMDERIEALFRTSVSDPQFAAVCETIMQRAYDEAYMLFVPTPNKVFAVNKEVVFEPYKMACIPLWKIQVTPDHWSVREGSYPAAALQPVEITRIHVP